VRLLLCARQQGSRCMCGGVAPLAPLHLAFVRPLALRLAARPPAAAPAPAGRSLLAQRRMLALAAPAAAPVRKRVAACFGSARARRLSSEHKASSALAALHGVTAAEEALALSAPAAAASPLCEWPTSADQACAFCGSSFDSRSARGVEQRRRHADSGSAPSGTAPRRLRRQQACGAVPATRLAWRSASSAGAPRGSAARRPRARERRGQSKRRPTVARCPPPPICAPRAPPPALAQPRSCPLLTTLHPSPSLTSPSRCTSTTKCSHTLSLAPIATHASPARAARPSPSRSAFPRRLVASLSLS
jgi:hypothetical protein